MYVMTIDQRGSTGDIDRVPGLLKGLSALSTAGRFERSVGDEVQGVVERADEVVEIALHALRSGRWYVGIGVGEVDLPLPASPREGSGPAFVAARSAVDRAKGAAAHVPLAVVAGRDRRRANANAATTAADGASGSQGARACANAEAVLRLIGRLVQDRTAAQWKVVDVLRSVRQRHPRNPRQPKNSGTETRNHGAVGEPRSPPLGLAGRMGREAGRRTAADPRPRQHRRREVNALWITLALLTAGFVGWPVTAWVFRLARTIDDRADAGSGAGAGGDAAEDPAADSTTDPDLQAAPEPAGPDAAAPTPAAAAAAPPAETVSSVRILRGGAIIGILERFAVCLAILAGQPVAIAYVVAIKGLGRFAELKATPVAAERFIIGTLTSMLWAAGVAALAKVLFLG